MEVYRLELRGLGGLARDRGGLRGGGGGGHGDGVDERHGGRRAVDGGWR